MKKRDYERLKGKISRIEALEKQLGIEPPIVLTESEIAARDHLNRLIAQYTEQFNEIKGLCEKILDKSYKFTEVNLQERRTHPGLLYAILKLKEVEKAI
jgi:hypothetical protein